MDSVRAISLFGKKSYSDLFQNISVLDEKDYFVLFDYFTLHLPISANWQKDRELNLFEESVLRMLSIGNYDVSALSEDLCLPPELVNFILIRLAEKGYVSHSNTITDIGLKYIGSQGVADYSDLVPVYVLVRRDNGEILPTLYHRSAMVNAAESDKDSRRVSVSIGTTGREENFSHTYIACKSTHNHKKLTNAEVHSIIRRHNNSSEHPIYIPKNIHVEYSFEGRIFVHTKFILQEGYVDNILASLGNFYHSSDVWEYASSCYPNLKAQIKENAASLVFGVGKKTANKKSERYKMLHKYLNTKVSKSDYETMDELQENISGDAQTVRSLNTAVEWALSYHLREIGIPESLVSTLKAQTPQQNGKMLLEMAEHAGLSNVRKHEKLFSYVSYSNFSAWKEGGEPSLTLLLPVAAGVARRKSDSRLIPALQVLHKKNKPSGDGLAFIARLADYAKNVRHGEKWQPTADDTIQSISENVLSFVCTLLPNYQRQEKVADSDGDYVSTSQRKLNAEVKVMKFVGDYVFYGLPEDVRRLMIESAILEDSGDSLAMVIALSSVLEKIFLSKIVGRNCEPSMQKVFNRLQAKKALPQGLSKVSPQYYLNAIRGGKKSTLGGYALAWVGSLEDDIFDLAVKEGILETVNEISGMRGHGAGSMAFDMEDVLAVQKSVFDIVKWLEGK